MRVALVSFGHIDSIISVAKHTSKFLQIDLFMIFAQNSKSTSIVSFNNINVKNGFIDEKKKKIICKNFNVYIGNNFNHELFMYDNLKLRSWKNFLLSFQLAKRLKQYDLIHINGQHGVLPQLQLLLLGKRIVYTIHDFVGHSSEKSWSAELMNKIMLFIGRKIIVQNKQTYSEIAEKYKRVKNKVHFIPFGVLEIYKLFGCKNIAERKNTILFFGRISPYKGVEYLIEAAKIARKKITNLKVVIAGSGQLYFDISDIKHNSTFQIINRYIPNSELAQLIQESSIVVCPYTDATQSGVVMTAYAFNKPVIATKVGGLAEAVSHNITGKLVLPKDPKSLSKAIIELLKNPDKIDKMSKNIELFCTQSEFSWENIAQKTIEVYEKTINKG